MAVHLGLDPANTLAFRTPFNPHPLMLKSSGRAMVSASKCIGWKTKFGTVAALLVSAWKMAFYYNAFITTTT